MELIINVLFGGCLTTSERVCQKDLLDSDLSGYKNNEMHTEMISDATQNSLFKGAGTRKENK